MVSTGEVAAQEGVRILATERGLMVTPGRAIAAPRAWYVADRPTILRRAPTTQGGEPCASGIRLNG